MRRRYRYGIFIASTILACAPLAMNNNVVKADAEPAQSNVKGGQQGAAGVTSDTKGDQQGKSADGVQQNGTQTDGDTNGETPAPATSKLGTSTATGEKAPQGDSTTQPVAKTDSEIPSAEVQHAGTKEDPHQITESYDNNLDPQTPIEINAIGATQNDAINYIRNNYGKNIHIHVDDNKADSDYTFTCTVKDKENHSVAYIEGPNHQGKPVSMLLEDGDVIQVVAKPRGLTPNTWYSWTPVDNQLGGKGDPIWKSLKDDLPDDIANRVVDDYSTTGKITEQTDENGKLPIIKGAKDSDGLETIIELGANRFTPAFEFKVSGNSKIQVPKSATIGRKRNLINGERVIDPDDPSYWSNNTGNSDYNKWNDITTIAKPTKPIIIIDDPASKDKTSWNDPTDTNDGAGFDLTTAGTTSIETTKASNPAETPEQSTNDAAQNNNSVFKPGDTKINVTNLNKLIFVHNAFIYDENGHVVQEDGAYQIKTQGQKVKILDNGRVYKFNGKDYYKIDSGNPDHPYYVRTSSVGNAPKKQAVVMRGTLKSYRVNVYSKNGKVIGTWKKANKVKFDKKMYKKGHTYYRIKGTKYWVRSTSVDFVKKQAKNKK